jgi:hypothetical protein
VVELVFHFVERIKSKSKSKIKKGLFGHLR